MKSCMPVCFRYLSTLLVTAVPIFFSSQSLAVDFSARLDIETRYFFNSPQFPDQHGSSNSSLAVEPEFYQEWNDGADSLTIKGFYRWDEHDSERTHGDLREFVWIHVGSFWETKIGISKVFWGVAESQHLVDIINQTDFVEATDGEEKLGQPMAMLSLTHDFAGNLDLYILPVFRERVFPGLDARLRFPLPLSDKPIYDSTDEDRHIDLAFRWSNSVGNAEIAISHFSGTSREPRIELKNRELKPVYDQIDQTGIEYQLAVGDWLWKLEFISRFGMEDPYNAMVGGFEYTFVGVWETDIDVGLIFEYHFDERKDKSLSPLQNDSFLGTRIAFNDEQSSEILAGLVVDNDTHVQIFVIEAARRIGDNIRLTLEGGFFSGFESFDDAFADIITKALANNLDPSDISSEIDPLIGFKDDSFIELEASWYY